MLPALLGKKIGMTQVYDEDGTLQPVTVVRVGPCSVLQIKTVKTDGYDAVQLGFEETKPHRAAKPQIGHAAKAGARVTKLVQEVRLPGPVEGIDPGQVLTAEVFENVSYVDVIGQNKGKGFAGVMKRHGFKGFPASHGTERKHRAGGSIGGHSNNAGKSGKIKKGKRMAGQMGGVRCTTRNHRLIKVDKENNLLLIKGAVPGANGGYVHVRVSKTAKVAQ